MNDIAGRVFEILIGGILLFILPLILYASKQDVTVQNYVNSTVQEFVDTSRTTGYISLSSYDRMIQKLDATGNAYEVKITHYESRDYPVEGDPGNYQTAYIAVETGEILETLYSGDHRYDMRAGDNLRVECKNISPTLFRKLLSFVYMRGADGGQIYTSYGGYVGNER